MAANNLTVRKGKCINFGNCKNADTKEIVEVNLGDEFICSECGGMLVEVKKQPPPKWILYAAIAVLLIGAIVFFSIKSTVDKSTELVKAGDKMTNTNSDTNKEGSKGVNETETSNPKPTEDKKEAGGIIADSPVPGKPDVSKQPSGPVIVEHATVKYEYGYYEGPTKDGLPHGTNGIMYFNQRHIINPKDPEERYAEAGEYVSGIFHDGFLVNGKYFGKDNHQKGAINIGR